mmetsp:Transcript_42781/g.50156  ORF Transcript_42781/g.50156 Transcript_42781/m.50156 type:complete len:373 (+) Transcript_42781:421-1539(+)
MSQTEIVLSALAETKKFVNGWKFTEFTESVWPLYACLAFSALRSKSFIDASIEALSTKSPVSWNRTFHTGCVCSVNTTEHHEFMKSHTLIVLSPPDVTKCEPAGWKSTPEIQSLWPSPERMFSPSSMFQIFQMQSSLTVARICFLKCRHMPPIGLSCALMIFWFDTLELRSSYSCAKNGFGRASSSGYGVFLPLILKICLALVLPAALTLDCSMAWATSSSLCLILFCMSWARFWSFSLSSLSKVFSLTVISYFLVSSWIFSSYCSCSSLSFLMLSMICCFSFSTRSWWVLWKSRSFLSFSQVDLAFSALAFSWPRLALSLSICSAMRLFLFSMSVMGPTSLLSSLNLPDFWNSIHSCWKTLKVLPMPNLVR